MAKFSLQEMYLTEYNRLIAALQTYFTAGASFTTIEQWVDYLNSVKSSKEIKKVDLNNIVFASDVTGTTTDYVQGSQSIELTKHNNLIAANIKKGVTVEGITGTLVDGSTIVKLSDIQDDLDSKILSSLEVGYNYWYYDDTAKELKSGAGKAQATQINKELTLGTDLLYSSGIFSLSETYANIPLKNLTVKPNAVITEIDTNADGNYVIPVGYVPTMLELPRLSDTEKTFLQNHLEYNKEILGVKGSNSAIVNTVNATSGNVNHIISGQKYWRNGIEYTGILQELTSYNVIQNDLLDTVTNTITAPVISGNSAIIIPANTYTHSNINFDITNLKAENIKNGVDIMGIVGNADIVDLYEGPVNIPIGTTSPILLPDEEGNFTVEADVIELKDKRLDSNIVFIPVAGQYANDIVVGKTIGGLSGTFSSRSNGFISYVTEDYDEEGNIKEVETTIEANGSIVKHSESNDIALDKYAFIEGRLVRGTNSSLVEQEEYTGDYLIELNDTTPPELLETKDKLLRNNVAISINADKINSSKIVYGSTMLGINGEFSHQETNPITASDVLVGKVGYVNGIEVTGNVPNYGDKIYSSSLKRQKNEAAGYYKTLTINPITFTKNSIVHTYEEVGGNTFVPNLIRKGWIVDGIIGTGLMLHRAATSAEVTTLVSDEEDNDVILYTGASITNSFQTNNYYEIVKSEEEIAAGAYGAPTAARLIRERDLNEATTDTKNILSGIVVYGNKGEKLTGTMDNYGKASYTITPSTDYTSTTITSGEGYYSGIEIKVNTEAIDANIIKSGESLFGVQGTYSPSLDTLNIDAPGNDWTTDAQGYLTKTYTPASGTDGWNQINIKSLIRKYTHSTDITENRQYTFNVGVHDAGAHGWSEVTFNVNVATPEPELDTLNVTSNGTYNAADKGVSGWDTVIVDVSNSGAPAIPTVKDYEIYMEGNNVGWLANGTMTFDGELSAYWTSINGNAPINLLGIDHEIDMSKVEMVGTSLGTVKFNPLFTNNATTSKQHIVAYFPKGVYCFPIWSTPNDITATAQSAQWEGDIKVDSSAYKNIITYKGYGGLMVSLKTASNTTTPVYNTNDKWKCSIIELNKPILIPLDNYSTDCMEDLSLLLRPVIEQQTYSRLIFVTGTVALTTDTGPIYQSSVVNLGQFTKWTSGHYAVFKSADQFVYGSHANSSITITYYCPSSEYVNITIAADGSCSARAYSQSPNSSVTLLASSLNITS